VEDLSVEELKQLINFYKQKASDLEFNLLQSQIRLNKIIAFGGSEISKPATKTVIDKK